MQMRLGWSVIVCFAAMLCATSGGAETTFRWANDGDVSSLDPYTQNEMFQLSFLANIYEPLIRRDRYLKLEPALATSWEQIGGTLWRFHLRDGVHWHDGSRFSADDVVFSVKRVRNEHSRLRSMLASIKAVHKIDDSTVDFETYQIDPIFAQEITVWVIMNKNWAERHHSTTPVDLASGQENYAVRNAMGTGPFKLTCRETRSTHRARAEPALVG